MLLVTIRGGPMQFLPRLIISCLIIFGTPILSAQEFKEDPLEMRRMLPGETSIKSPTIILNLLNSEEKYEKRYEKEKYNNFSINYERNYKKKEGIHDFFKTFKDKHAFDDPFIMQIKTKQTPCIVEALVQAAKHEHKKFTVLVPKDITACPNYANTILDYLTDRRKRYQDKGVEIEVEVADPSDPTKKVCRHDKEEKGMIYARLPLHILLKAQKNCEKKEVAKTKIDESATTKGVLDEDAAQLKKQTRPNRSPAIQTQ